MITPKIVGVLFFCCVMLTARSNVMVQHMNQSPAEAKIVLTLETESFVVEKDQAFFVTLTIENRTGRTFEFSTNPILRVEQVGQTEEQKEKLGPNYWSGISVLSSLPPDSEIRRRECLLPGEKVSSRVNLSDLKWGHSILSGRPSLSVFPTIPNGAYSLFFECEAQPEGKKRETVMSNVISIKVDR